MLKNYILDHVWIDYPGYISSDFAELFAKILLLLGCQTDE